MWLPAVRSGVVICRCEADLGAETLGHSQGFINHVNRTPNAAPAVYGYLDTWHGLSALLLLPLFVGGLWRRRWR